MGISYTHFLPIFPPLLDSINGVVLRPGKKKFTVILTHLMKRLKDKKFGTVGALARIGVSPERLHYWEKAGIVAPAYVKCGTRKFRRYSEQDIQRASFVKGLVDQEGYSLEGAKRKLVKEK